MDVREANSLLKVILDIGEEFIKSGAESNRAEDSLYRLCNAYGFRKVNIWLIPSNIQATVETPEGEIITQVRYVPLGGYNFDRLDYLNNLSRKACQTTPDAEGLREMLDEVLARPQLNRWVKYLAGVVGATSFGIFFNCDAMDAVVVAITALFVSSISDKLAKVEGNPLISNAILSFLAEVFILFCVSVGFGHNPNAITIGVVMLLIGAIGFTGGLRDLLNRDIIAGGINMTNALLGAMGIATGIALGMLVMMGVM